MAKWKEYLSREERALAAACRSTVQDHGEVPLPGMEIMRLVEHLLEILEGYESALDQLRGGQTLELPGPPQTHFVSWVESQQVWRDLFTGEVVQPGMQPPRRRF